MLLMLLLLLHGHKNRNLREMSLDGGAYTRTYYSVSPPESARIIDTRVPCT